jgi:hypothetical protein
MRTRWSSRRDSHLERVSGPPRAESPPPTSATDAGPSVPGEPFELPISRERTHDAQASGQTRATRSDAGAQLAFSERVYCFTGKLAQLKRSAAEREARARGAHTTTDVNERVDFLVIGSIPSPAWKFGDYGRKIEHALGLRRQFGKPRLVQEGEFMDALAHTPPTSSGECDTKLVVCNYKFVVESGGEFDQDGLESLLNSLTAEGAVASVAAHDVSSLRALYDDDDDAMRTVADSATVVQCRIVWSVPAAEDSAAIADRVERQFEPLYGIDGRLKWFDRTEGSADYIRLLREMPSPTRALPGGQ